MELYKINYSMLTTLSILYITLVVLLYVYNYLFFNLLYNYNDLSIGDYNIILLYVYLCIHLLFLMFYVPYNLLIIFS